MADQGIGWDIAEWLKSQIDKIPTMTDVENASYGMPIGGEAVRSGLRAASLAGAPIGAAGALLGTAMSEAETENAGSSDYLEAAKQGAKEGPRSAMDNINVLDVASLGAGALGGGLARGAKTAAKFGSLADAANLNKAAKVANLADLGLSGVDASLGAGQAAVGAREGDWADVGMGLARVGGNLVGANASLKDLGEGRAVKSIIDELGLKDTQAVSEVADAMKKSPTASYETVTRIADATGRGYDVDVRMQKNPSLDARSRAQAESLVSNPERIDGLNEATSFVRRLEEAANGEEIGRLHDTLSAISEPTFNPRTGEQSGPGRGKSVNMDTSYDRFPEALDRLKSRAGEFKGWFFGTEAAGTSDAHLGMKRNPKGTNPYRINPAKLVQTADYRFDFITDPSIKLDKEAFTNATYGLPYQLRDYAMSRKAGGEVVPELEKALRIEMFKERLLYTALHENIGHTPQDSPHIATGDIVGEFGDKAIRNPGYYTQIWDVSGTKQLNIPTMAKTLQPGNADTFSTINNQIFRAMNDPEVLAGIKAEMADPKMQPAFEKMYNAMKGVASADPLDTVVVPKKTGRTAGIREAKDAAAEFSDEQPPTPPGDQGPPVPPSDQPFGPPMKPIADRIRDTITSNRQVNVVNEAKKAEINNLRGQALKKINDEMAAGRMTAEEFLVERNRILSSEFGLTKTIQELPVTPQEQQMMIERIAQAAQDDNFIKANNISYWQKLRAGERLTEGELKSITDAITTKTTELQSDPTIMKFLKMGENLIGGSRAIMSSWDLSAAGRQALFASIMNPREARMAFKAQIDALKMTPKEFATFMDTLVDPNMNPMIDLANSSGLHISHKQGGLELGGREEHFINAAWAEKVPGVLRTEQAYIAYLNKMRVELFNKTAKQLMDSGIPIQDEYGSITQSYKDAAYMVNTLTGRGELSALHMSPNAPVMKLAGIKSEIAPGAEAAKNMHRALTNVFFAPRFAASRYALLRDATTALVGGNLDPAVYKIYMKNVMGTVGVMGSLAAAVVASGAGTFNSDPGKKDFGVLRVGKVRYDIFGGLKPWAKLAATMESDHYHDSRGKLKEFGSFGGKTKQGEIGRFVQGKLSPPASLLMEAITGEDFMGNKSTAWQKAYSHFTPMILQTITEAIQEGEVEQLPLAVPAAVLGIGVNTYSDSRRKYQ